MPTNHAGDKTLTQAPSAKPGPEGTITVALPIDSDPPNASTFAQPFKVLGDWVDWLLKPQGNTSLATKFVKRWRTAKGDTRFGLDRLGMPAGTVLVSQETWPIDNEYSLTVNFNELPRAALNGWFKITLGTGAVIRTYSARTSRKEHGFLLLSPGTILSNMVLMEGPPIARFHALADCVVEFPAGLTVSAASALTEMVAGLGQSNAAGNGVRARPGLWFVAVQGQTNWKAISSDGGAETVVDTGVVATGTPYAAGLIRRMRIEYRSAGSNDGGAAAAYYFIDGAHVATITTNLPTSTAISTPGSGSGYDPAAAFVACANNIGAPGAPEDLWIGPIHMTANLMPPVV